MRKLFEQASILFSWAAFALLLAALLTIIGYLFHQGGAFLNSRTLFGEVGAVDALLFHRQVFDGLFPALMGTFALVLLAVLLAIPIGIAAGIYMAEYARGKTKIFFSLLFDILAGLPSIVIGLAGFSITILLHKMFPGRIGPCLLLSAASLAFLILPYLIRTCQAALESVPQTLRQTAPALGASKIQNILQVLLPSKLPDILGGIILAIGRAAEDTAVIMLTGAVASAGMIRSLFEQFEALPFYIYYISSQYSNRDELHRGFGAALLLLALCALLFLGAWVIERMLSQYNKR
ncbi:phosphate ABC transporter permease PstA [Desulfotalea psychrophila]|uniref:Phosphate transport system permease protein PstA n=1 Tax=Desulfotalea psychrophila (strain LSv54 / DSM 12343) TaxID=177439 RepID=Q6ANW5_DESPS|nr:phosphate ABC transporter permease PstA [Desulfotalea psychrophila]CAG35959.1 related to phosphate ABC-transporter, permease protein [Desulfotalea psychrophila LSv54]